MIIHASQTAAALRRANDEQWTVSKPYAHAAPAKTRVLIRQDDNALGGAGGGGGAAAGASAGAVIGSDAPHSRVIGSDRLPAPRGRSSSAGELLLITLPIHNWRYLQWGWATGRAEDI